jgi:hypothetical protein
MLWTLSSQDAGGKLFRPQVSSDSVVFEVEQAKGAPCEATTDASDHGAAEDQDGFTVAEHGVAGLEGVPEHRSDEEGGCEQQGPNHGKSDVGSFGGFLLPEPP